MPYRDRGPTDWDTLCREFRWSVPTRFNLAEVVCNRHADDPGRLALIYEDEQGQVSRFTFRDIRQQANRLANVLRALGVERGDRVGVILPQRPETAVAHVALYKLAAVAVPLANLFGPEALEYRLRDSGAKAVLVDAENVAKVEAVRDRLVELEHVLLVDGEAGPDQVDLPRAMVSASPEFATAPTGPDDPALLIYTSGTTGPPKGALHAHRVLIGHLPGFELSHNFFPEHGDLGWTPADWAWIGGLIDLLLPCWYHGVPVLAHRARKFDPERALALISRHRVRNAFLPPTALKMIRQVPNIPRKYALHLRSIMSGGESLGAELLAWAQETLGCQVNEIYGQTEVNYVIGNCSRILPPTPGSMGKTYPGHTVAVIGEDGQVLPAGELGEIAFRNDGDPVFFLGYWNNPDATCEKYKGEWACSGDLAVQDEEGRFWFHGRKDDVIISAGYRIGPSEVEEQLLRHPAVAVAAAVGAPNELRGSIVKAFVKLSAGYAPSAQLAGEIQQFVKQNLAAHEYPREIEFLDELPLTTTGKIMRRQLRAREQARQGREEGPR